MAAMNARLLRPMASGGGFDPRSIAGLEMYLNAKVASSITLNGSNVSEWRDLSGNDRHASQATAANQPAFSATGWLGRPCVQFTRSSNHSLGFTPFAISAQTAFFMIEPTEAVPNGQRADIFNNNGASPSQNLFFFANVSGYKTYTVALEGSTQTFGADIFAQSRMLISHTCNGQSSGGAANHGIRKNRVQEAVGVSGLAGFAYNVGTIAGRTGGSTVFLSARFAAVLVYSRVLSAAEIEAVENWAVSEYPLA